MSSLINVCVTLLYLITHNWFPQCSSIIRLVDILKRFHGNVHNRVALDMLIGYSVLTFLLEQGKLTIIIDNNKLCYLIIHHFKNIITCIYR